MLYCDLNELFFEQLYLEITNECNMQCDYCFNCSGKYEKKYLSIKEIYTYVSIKNFSKNLPLLYLSGGEPLLHPMFKEIVNYLINEMKCKVVILSNGSLLNTLDMAQINKRVNWQIGSALLATKGMFDMNWTRYVDNIKYLKRLFPDSVITLAYTVTKENYMCLKTFIDKFGNKENIKILVSFVQKRGRGKDNWNKISLSLSQKVKLISEYSNYLENVKFCGVQLDKELASVLTVLKDNEEEQCGKFTELYIDYDRRIHFCSKLDVYLRCMGEELRYNKEDSRFYSNYFECKKVACPDYMQCFVYCLREGKGKICKIQ